MQAALTIGIAEVYLDRPIAIAEAYRSAPPNPGAIFGTYLLMAVLLFAVPTVAVVGDPAFDLESRFLRWHIASSR